MISESGPRSGLRIHNTRPGRLLGAGWRTLFVSVVVVGLIAAACGGDSDGGPVVGDEAAAPTQGATPAASTSEDAVESEVNAEPLAEPVDVVPDEEPPLPPLTASWTGVTEDTIGLGFTTSDLEELRRMGLVELDRGDPQLVLDSLIADVNERGGINGRMLEAHLEVVLPIGSAAAEAACLRLTEDIAVFAVLAPFVGPNSSVNPCINSQHATVIVGGQPTPEQLEESEAPWISNTMFSDRRLSAVVQLMEDEDLLGETIGLVVPAEERAAADDIVIPALEALGKRVIDVEVVTTTVDTVATIAAFEVFIERFKAEQVDSVVLVENTGTFGASELAKSDLDAQVLIIDSAQLVVGLGARGEVPLEDLADVIGSGVGTPEEEWELEATQDCIRVFEEANPEIDVLPSAQVAEGEPDWLGNLRIFCTPLRLFEMAAGAAGPELTHESFLVGAEGLGEIDLPFAPFSSLGPGKLDASDAVRLTQFDPTIEPVGGAKAYGPLVRVATG